MLIGSLTLVFPDPRGPIYSLVDSKSDVIRTADVDATATFKSYTMVYSPYWDFFILRVEGYSNVGNVKIEMEYLGYTEEPTGTVYPPGYLDYPPGGFDWELSAYKNIKNPDPGLPYWYVDQPGEFTLEFKVWPLDANGNKMDLKAGYYKWRIKLTNGGIDSAFSELYAD